MRTYADIDAASENDDHAVIFYLQRRPEDSDWQLDGDVGNLRHWYDEGLRILQLSYGDGPARPDATAPDERLGYGSYGPNEGDEKGVTDLGRAAIAEMNAIGMIVDCSHCSRQTTLDAAALSTKPVIATHVNAAALTPVNRNKDDEELLAIAGTGGVIGVTTIGWMLDTDGDGAAGMDDMIAHIEYMVDLVGVDHVGVSSDARMDGWEPSSGHYADADLAALDRWVRLTSRLYARGWTEEDLAKLLGGNFLRVFAEVLADTESMLSATDAAWEAVPVFTVGDRIGGYRPPGILDGTGAFEKDDKTVRVLVNHELRPEQGYAYFLANGMSMTGSRISYFDIDMATLKVKDAGLAYDTIINRYGETLGPSNIRERGDNGPLNRLCSAVFVPEGSYGLVDDVYLAGEETWDGQLFALDVASGVLHAVPQVGRASFENVALIDSGDPSKIALVVGDDYKGRPLMLYIGEKNALGDGSFLDRNGLAKGKVFTWVADGGDTTPEEFGQTGETRTGKFVEIEIYNPDMAGREGYDEAGYVTQERQIALGLEVGPFLFSRPEDLATNPEDGSEFVLASTGHGELYPSDDWGTLYTVATDIADLTATVSVVYSGDDAGNGQFPTPDHGLRNPDNLAWAGDGTIYVQEDRSTRIGRFGGASGREASVWQVNPDTGLLRRIAEVNRQAVPIGAVDTDADDLGDWETSGVIDVTNLFGAGATMLLVNVQAHSMKGELIGGENADQDMVEGGQILLLRQVGD